MMTSSAARGRALRIVMFGGPADWSGAWYSRHQLSAGLARRHKVVLVDEPRGWREALAHPRRLVQGARLEREGPGTLRYIHPEWLPRLYRGGPLRWGLDRLRARELRRLVNGEATPGVNLPVAYVWHPDHAEAVEPLADWPLVYHAYDRYDQYTGAPSFEASTRERWLVQRARVCIAASSLLADHLRKLGGRDVRLLRHAIDPSFLHAERAAQSDSGGARRPRIGLVASLSDAVDYRVLERVASARPGWTLVIVGSKAFTSDVKRAEFAKLERLANVEVLGFRPRQEIPALVSSLDVALTCYDLGTWAPFNQPLKLYEYLACGVPVVSSDIRAAQELGDLVVRVADPQGWVAAIERALAGDTPEHRARRRDFAREHTWERRVEELEQVLWSTCGGAQGRGG